MSKSIQDLKAAFKKNDNQGSSRPNNYYPFWNIPEGESATVRFLPDLNDGNELAFVVEKLTHNLTINGERKSVPCLTMYGEECPICKVSSQYYKADDKKNGKKYWRSKQHIAQALIIEDPLPADEETGETHEGKVRFLTLGFQIFNVIKDAFDDDELEVPPYDYKGGTNFIIKKTKQGDYAAYNLSKFARNSSDLTDDEIAMVQDQLIDLQTLLPQNPGLDKVESMLNAALNGSEYVDDEDDNSSSSEESAPVKEASDATSDTEYTSDAQNILDQIRSRTANKS